MDGLVTYFNVLLALYLGCITEQAPIPCDLGDNTMPCPSGMCCARGEFLLEQVSCKPYGDIDSTCTTVKSESNCPCLDGLICKPDITGSDFVTIYGKCFNTSVLDMTSVSESTFEMTTTTKPKRPIVNHPPVISFGRLSNSDLNTATVSIHSKVGTEIASFTATDIDRGKQGKVSCSILQPKFLRVVKKNSNSFQIVVASSIRHLSTQTLSAFVICRDGGKPPLNNVAQLGIKISRKNVTIEPTLRSTVTKTLSVGHTTTLSGELTSSDEEHVTTTKNLGITSNDKSTLYEQSTIPNTHELQLVSVV